MGCGRDQLLVQRLARRTMHEYGRADEATRTGSPPDWAGRDRVRSCSQRIPGFIVLGQIEPHLLILVGDTQAHSRVQDSQDDPCHYRRKEPGGHNGDNLDAQGTGIAQQ